MESPKERPQKALCSIGLIAIAAKMILSLVLSRILCNWIFDVYDWT
jgi:hypothetical protein